MHAFSKVGVLNKHFLLQILTNINELTTYSQYITTGICISNILVAYSEWMLNAIAGLVPPGQGQAVFCVIGINEMQWLRAHQSFPPRCSP